MKRILDLAASAACLVLLSPLLMAVAAAVRIDSPGPIFYTQLRAGRQGKPFLIRKFRSMRVNSIDPLVLGQVNGDHQLVTPVGRAVRRLKIDELPQLLNVAKGDMSLVGPRPALVGQAATYNREQRARLAVRPGLTGWAQVNGNTMLSWDERITLDLWYVRNLSFATDARIVLRTLEVVLFGERSHAEALVEAGVRRSS